MSIDSIKNSGFGDKITRNKRKARCQRRSHRTTNDSHIIKADRQIRRKSIIHSMNRVLDSDSITGDFLLKFFPGFSEFFLVVIVNRGIISEFKVSFLFGREFFSDHLYITVLLFNFLVNRNSLLHRIGKLGFELGRFLLKHGLDRRIILRIEVETHISLGMHTHNIPRPERINIARIFLGIVAFSEDSRYIKLLHRKLSVRRCNMRFIIRE